MSDHRVLHRYYKEEGEKRYVGNNAYMEKCWWAGLGVASSLEVSGGLPREKFYFTGPEK